MKSIIIYYSQYGSTKKIAQAIHAGMSQVVEQCDIATLKEIDTSDLLKYDLIGLGSPVWDGRASPNMMAFIERLSSSEGKHSLVFCTHGTAPGGYMANTVPALIRKGLTVIGWNDWYGSVTIPFKPKPYFTDGHPDEIDLKEAKDFGREMAERSRRIYMGETRLIPELPEGKEYIEVYGEDPKMHPKQAKAHSYEFKITLDKCTECMLCVDNCPTDSIDFSAYPPIFRSNCARCWYCEQICPEGAIEIDWEPVAKVDKKYGWPNNAEHLVIPEAKGRFRRLVPLEKVGWDTPWYKVSSHPRVVIP